MIIYLLKFGGVFCMFYFGTLAVIGLSTPENSYLAFVDRYLDFIDPLRYSILFGAKQLVSLLGYQSQIENSYTLHLAGGGAVRMVYSCIGYGVMSFWAAFVIANKGRWQTKLAWVAGGFFLLWLINILRVGLLLIALQKHWAIPFGWDHHAWFNIVAYGLIFLLMFFYDRSVGRFENKKI